MRLNTLLRAARRAAAAPSNAAPIAKSIALVLGLGFALYGQTYTLKTVVGSTPGTKTVPLNQAIVYSPEAVFVDSAGNTYIGDTNLGRVIKIDASGMASVIAGAASADNIGSPSGFAMDSAGNLFVADRGKHLIRRIDTAGKITTVAGVSGVGRSSGDGRKSSQSTLNSPRGLTFDRAGNLYVADTSSHKIRRIAPSAAGIVDGNGTIMTIAGTGESGSADQTKVTTDSTKRVCSGTNCISAISGLNPDDPVKNIGDTGLATSAKLNGPQDVKIGPDGNLYIADTGGNRIRMVNLTTGIIDTFAGTGGRGNINAALGFPGISGEGTNNANVNQPKGLAFDSNGDLWFSDAGYVSTSRNPFTASSGGVAVAARIRFVNPQGGVYTASSFTTPYDPDNLSAPQRIAIDGTGRILIADTNDHSVRIFNPSTNKMDKLITAGVSAGASGPATSALMLNPAGVAVDSTNNLYVSDSQRHQVYKVDATSGIMAIVAGTGVKGSITDGGPAITAKLDTPTGLVLNAAGDLFIAENGNNKIRFVAAADGTLQTMKNAKSVNSPNGLSIDASGNVYVANTGKNTVIMVPADLTTDSSIIAGTGSQDKAGTGDGGLATKAGLNGPMAVAVDQNSGTIYITDTGNHTVRGVISGYMYPIAGLAGKSSNEENSSRPGWLIRLDTPSGVAVDSKGILFIADTNNGWVRKYDPNTFLLSTVNKNFNTPTQMATDAAGDVFVADGSNARVYELVVGK